MRRKKFILSNEQKEIQNLGKIEERGSTPPAKKYM
jgi:hypothetical protein